MLFGISVLDITLDMENNRSTEAQEKAFQEFAKLHFDLLKHLSTLCTGLVLILGTIVQKAFVAPVWVILLPIAILFFVAALAVAIWTMLCIPGTIRSYPEVVNTDQTRLIRSSIPWVFLLFFTGLSTTVVFLIRNVLV